ncbi:methyl-accepting chemotaxis protein [Tissierella sp.]|uniref:methyl-accepting chemotaxis protein n=1 Tax=Tissierella sp. TaxID=41274 RepID=UPI0028623E4B|nr:methyl-accepting chemotaxis protein [Tissierella sp.]MDR7855636.1 methyl-accepting chemotaxis protein [Tissierella sp.]
MKRNIKSIIGILLLAIIFFGVNHLTAMYLNNMYIKIGILLILSVIFTLVIVQLQKNRGVEEIVELVSKINDLDFTIQQDMVLSEEAKENIYNVAKQIRNNLRTQVEISTEIFNECESLGVLSTDSLSSAELVATSVEISDSNTREQSLMLKKTNDLTDEIISSMKNVERDIMDKIQFIASSITSAQKGLGKIHGIEDRIKNSKSMVKETSQQMTKLKNYSDEVGGLVDLIHSISSETKMLSLNASIEAARAGEEGKGFSVVATEVGKLAEETDKVSKKIEEVMNVLRDEIASITSSMVEEMEYMDENCKVIEVTNEELGSIVETLNLGKESLEQIKDVTGQNNKMIEEVTINIDKITQFSEETSSQMVQTTDQTMDQHNRAKSVATAVEKIRDNVYNMQQFVVGKVMEEKMLKQAYEVKDFFINNKNVSDNQIKQLIKEVGIDAIYITDSSGIVEYTNEKDAIGLNLYVADPSFADFESKKKEYIVTPIKKRMEDGKLFKFLTVTDENKKLYEVGLGIESLLKDI